MDEDVELSFYLDSNKNEGIKHGDFAAEIGVDKCTLSRIKNYEKCPSAKLAMKIEEKTKGKVKWWKLIQKYEEKQEQKRLVIKY